MVRFCVIFTRWQCHFYWGSILCMQLYRPMFSADLMLPIYSTCFYNKDMKHCKRICSKFPIHKKILIHYFSDTNIQFVSSLIRFVAVNWLISARVFLFISCARRCAFACSRVHSRRVWLSSPWWTKLIYLLGFPWQNRSRGSCSCLVLDLPRSRIDSFAYQYARHETAERAWPAVDWKFSKGEQLSGTVGQMNAKYSVHRSQYQQISKASCQSLCHFIVFLWFLSKLNNQQLAHIVPFILNHLMREGILPDICKHVRIIPTLR